MRSARLDRNALASAACVLGIAAVALGWIPGGIEIVNRDYNTHLAPAGGAAWSCCILAILAPALVRRAHVSPRAWRAWAVTVALVGVVWLVVQGGPYSDDAVEMVDPRWPAYAMGGAFCAMLAIIVIALPRVAARVTESEPAGALARGVLRPRSARGS